MNRWEWKLQGERREQRVCPIKLTGWEKDKNSGKKQVEIRLIKNIHLKNIIRCDSIKTIAGDDREGDIRHLSPFLILEGGKGPDKAC